MKYLMKNRSALLLIIAFLSFGASSVMAQEVSRKVVVKKTKTTKTVDPKQPISSYVSYQGKRVVKKPVTKPKKKKIICGTAHQHGLRMQKEMTKRKAKHQHSKNIIRVKKVKAAAPKK